MFNISDERKRFSSSKYKKHAKDKQYKESKILNKIPKQRAFFKPVTTFSFNVFDGGQQHDLKGVLCANRIV